MVVVPVRPAVVVLPAHVQLVDEVVVVRGVSAGLGVQLGVAWVAVVKLEEKLTLKKLR